MGEMADLWDKYFGDKVSHNPAENLKWIENEQLKLLLKEAHDKMDDYNANLDKHIQRPMCHWCSQTGYNAGGLDHTKDCILVKIRQVVHV